MSDVDTDISKEVSNCSNTKEPSKLKALEALEDKQKNKMLRSSNLLFQIKGNSYVAPGKLRALLEQQNLEKSSVEYQRISWEALKKSINGHVNKANIANIAYIVQDLLKENIVRGRGIFAQSIIHAQMSSPVFTHIHACLVAIVNSKLPKTGELILKRLVNNFRRAFKRNDKKVSINSAKFIGHLVNQNVAHEIIALEILTLLLENVTEDSIEVAIGFLKEVGKKLSNISPRGLNAVFNRLRSILNEGKIDKRFQYMIEVMHAIRKDKFKDHIDIITELDLVEETDQITHLIRLDDQGSIEENLDVFQFDLNFEENEDKYKQIVAEILDIDSDDDMDDNDNEDEDEDEEDENDIRPNENIVGNQVIIDNTETNMISLRRTIYLTIYSSLDYEECAHKLLKLQLKPGQEHEFCNMIVDCCAQQRTYEKFYGLLAQRFCLIKNEFLEEFIKIFNEQYDTCHRLDIVKLRNTCKLFGHLLFSDAIPWMVLECIHLNEEETTSSSRIFIKILFQELAESMGLKLLIERLRDETLVSFFRGIFPIDNPRNTRFSINFFTAIGLGGITDDLRNFLKTTSKYSNNQPTESMVAGPIPNKNIDSANKLLNKASEIMLNIKDDIKSSNINHFKVDSDSGSDNRNLNIKSKEIPKRNPDRKNTPNYSSKKKSKRSISSESTSSSKSKHKEINLLKQKIKKSKFFKDKKAIKHHDIRKKNSISEKIKPSKKHYKKSRSSSSSDSSGSDSSRSSNKSKNQRSTKKLPKKYLHKNY